MRVLHIPARTPYARKLIFNDISIINGTWSDGVEVPRDASFEWLVSQKKLSIFLIYYIFIR